MGAVGVTLIVGALLIAYEALKLFRSSSTAQAAAAPASGGSTGGTGTTTAGGAGGTGAAAPAAGGVPAGSLPATPPAAGGSVLAPVTPSNPQSVLSYPVAVAQNLGIDPLALLALVSQESAGSPTAVNAQDPGGSYGLYQLNRNANPYPIAQLEDPAWSSAYWQKIYGPTAISLWNTLGGEPAFQANPVGFLQQWVPAVQVSQPWDTGIASRAYAQAQAWLQGL